MKASVNQYEAFLVHTQRTTICGGERGEERERRRERERERKKERKGVCVCVE